MLLQLTSYKSLNRHRRFFSIDKVMTGQEFVTIAFPAFVQFLAEPLASLVGKTKQSPNRVRLNEASNQLHIYV